MKSLLRLYPRRWRDRYGTEMGALLEQLPGDLGIALDLLGGAAAAYADLVRGNRVLSGAAAFLHGVSVAVLVQAIVFVLLVLASQQSPAPTVVELGPLKFASVAAGGLFLRGELSLLPMVMRSSLPAVILLIVLVAVTALVAGGPRWVRRSPS